MSETAEKPKEIGSGQQSEEDLRAELYRELGVSTREKVGIRYILPILDRVARTDSRYEIDTRSKILAEVALIRAYIGEPKLRVFTSAALLLAIYDILHPLNPRFYWIFLGAIATINGFLVALRSPSMIAAELEEAKGHDGMPAHYRAKALSSVNTNITLVLFVLAVGVQLVVTSSLVEGELLTANVADGILDPWVSAFVLAVLPIVLAFIRGRSDED